MATQDRGFGTMVKKNPERQREIARTGGRAISQNREYMKEIGRRGGKKRGAQRRMETTSSESE